MPCILVVGLRERDSGKTTIARLLISLLRERGISVCGFKPKAGNHLWYNFEIVHEALGQGRMYGMDAKILREASATSLPEEIINPLHRLWVEDSLADVTLNGLPAFLLDRVTLNPEGEFLLTLNEPAMQRFSKQTSKIFQKLLDRAKQIIGVSSPEELGQVIEEYYDKAVWTVFEVLKRRYDMLVVESYCDIALPWNGLENVIAVVGVKPWRLHLYDASQYLTAARLTMGTRKLEASTSQLERVVKPIKTFEWSPSLTPWKNGELRKMLSQLIEEAGL